jgi:hypothetical protein
MKGELMTTKHSKGSPYEVGYRRPPVSRRFQPGRSGNPQGRPRGAKNLETVLCELAARKVTVHEGGKARRMTLLEAIVWRHASQALKGDRHSTRLIIEALRNIDLAAPEANAAMGEDDRRLIQDTLERLLDRKPEQAA